MRIRADLENSGMGGAKPGNRNALRHGRFTAAAVARRRALARLMLASRYLYRRPTPIRVVTCPDGRQIELTKGRHFRRRNGKPGIRPYSCLPERCGRTEHPVDAAGTRDDDAVTAKR